MLRLGRVVTVYADPGRYWRDGTLAETEARLDPRRFVRLDQSHLINVTRIGELAPWTHQRYRLLFTDAAKTELVVSRGRGEAAPGCARLVVWVAILRNAVSALRSPVSALAM